MFFSEFCEIYENIINTEYLHTTISVKTTWNYLFVQNFTLCLFDLLSNELFDSSEKCILQINEEVSASDKRFRNIISAQSQLI